jgi:hypothetical protein
MSLAAFAHEAGIKYLVESLGVFKVKIFPLENVD